MAQEWITLNEKPAKMGRNFDLKGVAINAKTGNPNLNKIELTQEDIEKINSSELKIAEGRSLRDCFDWSSPDPDEYIHRLTDHNERELHLRSKYAAGGGVPQLRRKRYCQDYGERRQAD